ncbi:zinc finger MYM-type protein 1-like protein, partial [Tanacetum coccineum]
ELNMSTVKKKVRILDWFTPIQKKGKTQDGCFSTPQPLIDPLPKDTETRTRNDKTNHTEKEKDFNVSDIPHDSEKARIKNLKIGDVSSNPDDQLKAETVSYALESFDFVFLAHLMKRLSGVANDLNYALQKKDQDIVEAMSLVELTKERLQIIRNDGWEDHLKLTISFCEKNRIEVPKMEDVYVPRGRKKRRQQQVTNLHHFRVEVFCTIIDLQLQELNNRFNEVNSKLLICMGSLSPLNCFSSFNSKQLITLAEFYPNEFPRHELSRLSDQLDNYIHDMRKDERFIPLKDVGDLSLKLVELKKHTTYDLVYLLIKLVLILPVATASVERTFSAMTYVKNKLRNSIGDQFLNDCLVTYIEKDVFFEVSDDTIMNRFQRMRRRRGKLY